jgi:hypothetical protein
MGVQRSAGGDAVERRWAVRCHDGRMDAGLYVEQVRTRLSSRGVQVDEELIGGFHCLVGYVGEFRIGWAMNTLHLFTILATPKHPITADLLEPFANDAIAHTVAEKGAMRGIGSTVGTIPVMAGPSVAADGITLAESKIVGDIGSFAWPCAVDLSSDTLYSHVGPADKFTRYAEHVNAEIEATLRPTV